MESKARRLRHSLSQAPIVRLVGAHNGLGAKLIEANGFEGVWASGLEISTTFGVPDANILTMTENLQAASAIHEATALPIVCDCDTGYGNVSNVIHMVKKYEAAGLAAAVIEDKRFPKVNSFIAGRQELEPMEDFAGKIRAAKNAQKTADFMVFARLEALIAGWGMDEALRRARAYADAGADGIVVHSKAATPDEIFTFAKSWDRDLPLVAIPTTYPDVTAEELARRGFRMVIYANHGIRAAIRAMNETFRSIRETGSTAAVEARIATMKEVFEIQGMPRIKEEETLFSSKEPIRAVIPAAGDPRRQGEFSNLLDDRPLCMLPIGGKTLLERQIDLLASCRIPDVTVIGGYHSERLPTAGIRVLQNPDYKKRHTAHSIMLGIREVTGKTAVLYSDILFDRSVLDRLAASPHAVTIAIDRAYKTLSFRRKLSDLVRTSPDAFENGRCLNPESFKSVERIAKQLTPDRATHEFIGLAFLNSDGVRELKNAWTDALSSFKGRSFYEAPSPEEADFTDLLQYLIDRGVPVRGLEIEHGWVEIHSLEDYERVNSYFGAGETVVSGRDT